VAIIADEARTAGPRPAHFVRRLTRTLPPRRAGHHHGLPACRRRQRGFAPQKQLPDCGPECAAVRRCLANTPAHVADSARRVPPARGWWLTETPARAIEDAFKDFTSRDDIAVVLINQYVRARCGGLPVAARPLSAVCVRADCGHDAPPGRRVHQGARGGASRVVHSGVRLTRRACRAAHSGGAGNPQQGQTIRPGKGACARVCSCVAPLLPCLHAQDSILVRVKHLLGGPGGEGM
jgi:hypothetical protein